MRVRGLIGVGLSSEIPPHLIISLTRVCVCQAAAYGKCVAATTTGRQELKKDACSKEFGALKTCFMDAVSDWQTHSTGFMSLSVFKGLLVYCRRREKANERKASWMFEHTSLDYPVKI